MRFSPIKSDTTTNATSAPVLYARVSTAAPAVPDVASAATSVTIKTATHTKRQCPIWIAQLTARVERVEFSRLHTLAKAAGGYWSSFGPVEIHGFIFFEETKANAFALIVNPSPQVTPGKMAVQCPPSPPVESVPTNIVPLPDPRDTRSNTALPPMPAWRARLLRRA